MKKIVFFATTPFAVNAFLKTHMLLLAKNYEVSLCVNLHAYELAPTIFQSVKVVHIDYERNISLLRDIRSLYQTLRALWRIRPDAVHSITPKAGLLTMFAAFIARVPHRHHTFTGQVWANKKGFKRILLKTFDRLISFFATTLFVDSASQGKFLVNEGVVSIQRLSMLGVGSIAGVNLDRFRPSLVARQQVRRELDTPNDACVVLFVGRLTGDKGVFVLVESFAKLAKVDRNATLWVVGPDEEDLLEELKQVANPCSARIRWVGATTSPERYMAASDFLALPSYREGFGTVIIEAAACGIPTLAFRIDGVVDAVLEDVTGCLVEAGNNDAYANSMQRLALDETYRGVLGSNAQARASRNFSSTAISAEWLEFYQKKL